MFTTQQWLTSLKSFRGILFLAILLALLGAAPRSVQANSLADPPSPPQLSAPADWANVATLTPKLSWTAVSGAKGYVLEVSTSQDFSTGIFVSPSVLLTSYTIPTGYELSFGTTYYWKVVSCGTAACDIHSSFSAERRFTVTNQKSPSDGAYSTSQTPSFSWTAAAGATDYTLYLCTHGFIFICIPYDLGTALQYHVPKTSPMSYNNWSWYVAITLNPGTGSVTENTPTWHLIVTPTLPPAPTGLSLNAKSPTSNTSPIFSWQPLTIGVPPDDVYQYQVQVDTLSSFAHPLADGTTGSSSDQLTPPAPATGYVDGNYYWRVRAIDHVGAAGKWSKTSSFTIDTMPPLNAYDLSPVDYTITSNHRPTFKWSKPSGGAVKYILTLRSEPSSNYLVFNSTTTSYTPTSSQALPDGKYLWYVQAQDAAGNLSPVPVNVFYLFIQTSAPQFPAVPVQISPANNALMTGQTPTFSWKLPASQIYIDLSLSPSFSSDYLTFSVYNNGTSAVCPSSLDDNTYYWRMRAQDSNYNSSPWSSVRSFTIRNSIGSPALLAPALASTNGTRPTFKWSAVPGAVSYSLQYRVNGGTTTTVNLTKTSYTPSSPLDFGSVDLWTVLAKDAVGNVTGSNNNKSWFYIAPQISPGGDINTSKNKPTFKWTAYKGASSYELIVTGPLQITTDVIIDEPVQGTSFTPTTPAETLPPGEYKWIVLAKLGGSTTVPPVSVFEMAFYFVVTSNVPPAPVLLLPADKSATNNATPVFLWNEVTGASAYEIQLSLSPSFTHVLNEFGYYTVPSPAPVPFEVNNLTLSPPLNQDWTVYWRARAQNSLYAFGPWSKVRSFLLEKYLPAAPILLSPAFGGSVTNPQLSLSWSKVADAVSYDLWFAPGAPPAPTDLPIQLGKVTSYKLPVTIAEGTYYWTLEAVDAAGIKSAWITPQSFSLLAGQTVPKPSVTPTPTVAPSAGPTTVVTEPTVSPVTETPAPAQPTVEPATVEPSATPEPTEQATQPPTSTMLPVDTETPEPTVTPTP